MVKNWYAGQEASRSRYLSVRELIDSRSLKNMFTRLIPDRSAMVIGGAHRVHDDMDPTQPRDGKNLFGRIVITFFFSPCPTCSQFHFLPYPLTLSLRRVLSDSH